MKIAIPVNAKDIKSSVCDSFGRTPYFLIYNTETNEETSVDNSAAASTGGAGIKAAQIIIDNQVNALLTLRLGTNAADVLKSANISIYAAISGSAKYNLDAFVAGKLSLLDEIHSGFHGSEKH